VTYTITVKNTGQTGFTASDPATLTDDLSGVLDDATYNGDATDGTTVTGHALHWSGPLAIGATAVIKYSITVDKPDTGDKLLKNVVQLPPDENSNCSSDSTDPACRTVTPVAQYDVVKKASSAQVKEGARVTYTITVTNTGQAGYPAAHPATLRDDLSGVLDDATYDHDATSEPTGTVTYTAPVLSWAGALPIGATIKVTYTVTVDKPDHGNGKLDNVVTTPEAPNGVDVANCSPNSTDPSCSTETGVSSTSSPPASTGNDTQLQLILAALLLASGGVFLALGLRRRRMNR
jgi:archaellum component FlaG (FlaF/FlaG flagellin family)